MDFKARYSQISSGAINFNASLALVDAAAFLNTPSFYPNPNDQKFVYINNIKPKNEQENLNLSLRGDWDLSFATLSGYVAYNDQQNYFLTDGTSAAFQLYGLEPDLPGLQRRAERRAAAAVPVLLPPVEHLVHAGSQRTRQLPAALQPDDLRRLPVPGAQPVGHQHRGAAHVAGRRSPALGRRPLLRLHRSRRRRFPGFRPEPGPLGQGVRAHERQEPDRPAVRRHVQHQRLFDLRPARLRRGRERRARARAALRQRAARREQQREDLQLEHAHRVPRADAALQLRVEPVHQPRLHGDAVLRDERHPGPQQDLLGAAAEAVGQLGRERRDLALRLVRLRVPQRRLQLLGQRGDDQPVLRQPVLFARRAEHLGREGRLQERDLRGRRDRHEVDPARPAPAGEPRRVLHARSKTCSSSTSSSARSACCAS